MSRILTLALLLSCLPAARAQEAMWLPGALGYPAGLTEHRPGREPDTSRLFIVTIAADGHVESAVPMPNETRNAAEVAADQAAILSQTYKPWTWEGKPVRVRQLDSAPVHHAERERWADTAVSFPDHPDLATAKIVLYRGIYEVIVTGDGTVHFTGYDQAGMVQHTGILFPGESTAHIPVDTVRTLLDQFRKAHFLSTLDDYGTDMRAVDGVCEHIGLTLGSQKKSVAICDDAGDLPQSVSELMVQVEDAADVKRWTEIDAGTLPWLLEQHWNFAAATAQNFDLYSRAIRKKDEPGVRPLLDKFLSAKVPVFSTADDQASPICAASLTGDLALVRLMATGIKSFPHPIPTQCLQAAARSGSLDVFNFWRDHGAVLLQPDDPPKPGKYPSNYFPNLLQAAFEGRNSAIIRALLHSGGDITSAVQFAVMGDCTADMTQTIADIKAVTGSVGVNLADFALCPAVIRPILQAGADPNTNFGPSGSLIDSYAYSEPVVRLLLAAGAIPTPKALTTAKDCQCNTCVALLQAALDKLPSAKAP